ncbi:hypothetical protein ABZP36_006367 [Zizania latifolia]
MPELINRRARPPSPSLSRFPPPPVHPIPQWAPSNDDVVSEAAKPARPGFVCSHLRRVAVHRIDEWSTIYWLPKNK